jgi:hypothetical protein
LILTLWFHLFDDREFRQWSRQVVASHRSNERGNAIPNQAAKLGIFLAPYGVGEAAGGGFLLFCFLAAIFR